MQTQWILFGGHAHCMFKAHIYVDVICVTLFCVHVV